MRNSKIRVLELNGRSDFGGGPKNVYRLLRSIDKEKFQFFIACPQEPPYYDALCKIEGLTVIPLELRSLSMKNFLTLRKVVRENQIQIVHSQGKAAGVWSRLLKIFFPKLKVVHHFRGIHYKQYPEWFQKVYFKIEQTQSWFTNQVVHVSESEMEEAQRLNLCTPKRQTVIYNGVETPETLPLSQTEAIERFQLPRDTPICMTISRYSYQKNLERSFQILQKVVQAGMKMHFVIIGEADDISEEELIQSMEEFQIREHVTLADKQKNILEWLCAADLYLNTARWEGLPTAVMEAMSAGIPVVASRVTGNTTAVTPETGILVREDDTEGYVEAIQKLLQDENLRKKLGEAGKKRVSDEFSILRMVKTHEKLYRKLSL